MRPVGNRAGCVRKGERTCSSLADWCRNSRTSDTNCSLNALDVGLSDASYRLGFSLSAHASAMAVSSAGSSTGEPGWLKRKDFFVSGKKTKQGPGFRFPLSEASVAF